MCNMEMSYTHQFLHICYAVCTVTQIMHVCLVLVLILIIAKVDNTKGSNLETDLGSYFICELDYFQQVSHLDKDLEGYFRLFFIMAEVDNLDIDLGGLLWTIFHNCRNE